LGDKVVLHNINFNDDRIGEFCRRNGITRLAMFGSILTDRSGPDSDVVFLVEFDWDRRVSLFDVGGMCGDLSGLIGRVADLRTAGDLSPYFRDYVIYNARLLYAA
jgi:predicted nucleotidyltransferase